MPAVTMLTSVYNGMPDLPESIESIRRQTCREWTMLIVNDGSTDGTVDYLNQLDDPRIRVIHQHNKGLAAALNYGLEHCETEFVARIDADDVALPTRLEKQLAFLRAHPKVGMVGTQFRWLFKDRTGAARPIPCDHRTIDTRHMKGRHGLVHSTVMCRTALLRKIGGYWSIRVAQDWDMFLKMAEHAELANLDEVLLYVRVVESSTQSVQMAKVRASVAYACESARRRRGQLPPIAFDEFCHLRAADPWWKRFRRALDVEALRQYRIAQSEILGGRPLLGYARLAWAATCSPQLTCDRIGAVVRQRWLAPRQLSRQDTCSAPPGAALLQPSPIRAVLDTDDQRAR